MSKKNTENSSIGKDAPPTLRDLPPDAFGRVGLDRDQVLALNDRLDGTVLLRELTDYDHYRRIDNPAFQIYPKIIVVCKTPEDVAACLDFAHKADLWITTRSSGHSTAGYSVNDGLVLDVSNMNQIHVDESAMRVSVGPGVQFGNLNKLLDEHRLHVPGGDCPGVCVAGYMQGGGYGYTSRRYGMNCDNVLEVKVMLRDGRIVKASPERNPDLFWALRGGTGNNFGVVLEITYQLHDLWKVWGFAILWPLAKLPQAMLALQKGFMKSGNSSRVGYMGNLFNVKGDNVFLMQGMYTGSEKKGKEAVAALIDGARGKLVVDHVDTYVNMIEYFDNHPYAIPGDSDPEKEDKQSAYIARPLSASDWEQIANFQRTTPNADNMTVIEPYGGAINAYPVDQSAFIHRDVECNFFVDVFWSKDDDGSVERKWLDEYMNLVVPLSNGRSYQNYPRRGLEDFREMYWGDAFDDLLWVKNKFDPPPYFFHYEQSISPHPNGKSSTRHQSARPPRFSDSAIDYEL